MGIFDWLFSGEQRFRLSSEWVLLDRTTQTDVVDETDAGTIKERHSHKTYRHIETGEERTVQVPSKRDSSYKRWIEFDDGKTTTLDKHRTDRL